MPLRVRDSSASASAAGTPSPLALRRRAEAERREALDRETLLEFWIRDGNDAAEFEEHYRTVATEAKTSRLREMDRDARESFSRMILNGF